jgi:hypothetical protein
MKRRRTNGKKSEARKPRGEKAEESAISKRLGAFARLTMADG